MSGCRTEFTQGGVNKYRNSFQQIPETQLESLPRFEDYEDDKMGERVLKSGRAGFVGWMGFGGSVMQWHPGLDMGFGYTCSLLTWWDLANTKARKLQKEAVKCAVALRNENVDVNNNKSELDKEKAQEENTAEGVAAA